MIRPPVSVSNCSLVAFINAIAPENEILIDEKSTLPARTTGLLSMAWNSVGTLSMKAGRVALMVFSTSARSRGFGTSASGLPLARPSPKAPTLAYT